MLPSQVMGVVLLVVLGLAGGVLLCLAVGQAYWASTALRVQQQWQRGSESKAITCRRLYGLAAVWLGCSALVIGGEVFAVKAVWERYFAPPPLHRVIAYVSDQNGSNDIWLMDEYGHTRALTFDMANERQPRWSPDGQWLLFLSDQAGNDDIFIMSSEGAMKQALTRTPDNEDWISWSPDGNAILFTRGRLTDNQLCILSVDVIRQVATGESCIFITEGKINKPSFSPDGRQIVFNLGRGGWFRLWIVNGDGTNAHPLDSTTQSGIAAWSPDGKRIVYRRAADYNKPSDLQIISPDEATPHHVRHIEASQVQANWSPDGQRLYFTSDPSDPPLADMGRLGIVSAEGSKLIWLDDGENWVYGQAQSWQIETWDEHDRIVYSHKEDGQYDLYLIDSNGSDRTPLTDTPANEFHAVFRPVLPLKQR